MREPPLFVPMSDVLRGINRKKFYIGDVIVVIGSFFENGFLAAEVYKQ